MQRSRVGRASRGLGVASSDVSLNPCCSTLDFSNTWCVRSGHPRLRGNERQEQLMRCSRAILTTTAFALLVLGLAAAGAHAGKGDAPAAELCKKGGWTE